MHLWLEMMMQNVQTKQAEENWNLHQYNFLADSRKTVPLACRSENWIQIATYIMDRQTQHIIKGI